jgi:hypothetical protein
MTKTGYSPEEKSGQFWRFISVSKGTYRIQSVRSNLYLTCSHQGRITQEKYTASFLGRQLWKIFLDREGNYHLQSIQTRFYLTYFRRRDPIEDTIKDLILGTNIIKPEGMTRRYSPEYQMRDQRKSAQYWKILPVD